ncbi:MAG: hypothetical protein AAGA65_09125 [Actinomycetota bacterium]
MAHATLTQPLSRLLQPSFVLDYDGAVGTGPDGVQLQCWSDGITPNVSEGGDFQTFCDPFERTWDVSLKMTWELHALLKPMENQEVKAATQQSATKAVSANNREESFTVEVPSIPSPISGGVRSVNAVTLTFNQVGPSVFADTPAAAVTTPTG